VINIIDGISFAGVVIEAKYFKDSFYLNFVEPD
jgi:hypothetical protein